MSEAATESRPARSRRQVRRNATRLLIVAALYFSILVYPVLRLVSLLLPGWTPGTLALLAVIVLPLALRMSHERWPGAATRVLSSIALTWLGVCFQLFAMMLVFEIANLCFALPHRTAGIAMLIANALLTAIGFANAQWLRTRTVRIPAPAAVAGKRLVQVSDVHVGSRSPALLVRIAARVRSLAPDYVAITGDLVDFSGISHAELAPLANLGAPTYFAIGNHERYVDLADIDQRLRGHGLRVLRDSAEIDGPFQFIGVDDDESLERVAARLARISLSQDHYGVLLYHRPDGFDAAAERGIPLTLSGHTHAGQLIPFNFIVKRVFPRMVGLFELNGSRLYVSPGTGTWGPILRIGSRSEITVIEFVAA